MEEISMSATEEANPRTSTSAAVVGAAEGISDVAASSLQSHSEEPGPATNLSGPSECLPSDSKEKEEHPARLPEPTPTQVPHAVESISPQIIYQRLGNAPDSSDMLDTADFLVLPPLSSPTIPSKRKTPPSASPPSPLDVPLEEGNKDEISLSPDTTESLPTPRLTMSLPSNRAKKSPHSRSFHIPTEQLPVFPLPPLPPIEDPEMLKRVFTHQSSFPRVRFRFEDPPDEPAGHYEKLEHVGDSILGMVVTCWLHEVKPELTCGSATQLKAHLVSNATLSHLSGLYNLPQRLRGHPELLPTLRAQVDTRAALMEAYIAGIYFSHPPPARFITALPIIDTWLREMYRPLLAFFYDHMCLEHVQHHSVFAADVTTGEVITMSRGELDRIDRLAQGMSGLVQLYARGENREFEWEETRCDSNLGKLWKVFVRIDGIEVGEAMRVGKKAARNAACYEAAKRLGLAENHPLS